MLPGPMTTTRSPRRDHWRAACSTASNPSIGAAHPVTPGSSNRSHT